MPSRLPDLPPGLADELLATLNPEQRSAVTHDDGPLLIVAGAGTGKTSAATKRIAWLVATGRATPDNILALTFTDKAANEMRERVEELLPLGYVDFWISTFHAFCQKLLEKHGLDIGIPHEFTLLADTDAYLLVHRNFEKFALSYYRPRGNPYKFIHALLNHFSRCKDEGITPEMYLDYANGAALDKDITLDSTEVSRLQEIANAYHTYQKLLLDNGCLDLGDLLHYTLELLRTRPAIRAKYQAQFRHVMVDEFQDTNWAQYELVKLLVGADTRLAVVGDDDQAIYKFRGASLSNILTFKEDFPKAKTVALTRNYRSLQNVLDASYDFICQNNPNRLEHKLAAMGEPVSKRLVADREGLATYEHLGFATGDEEAAGVASRIIAAKEADDALNWNDFVVLSRSNAGADGIVAELVRRGVPYQFLALKGLYGKPAVLDAAAYLAMVDDPHESANVWRTLASSSYRVDAADLATLSHEAYRKGEPLIAAVRRHLTLNALLPETHAAIERLLADVAKHAALARDARPSELFIRHVYDCKVLDRYQDDEVAENREALSHLNQFLSRIKRFEEQRESPTLRSFLAEYRVERDSGEEGGLPFDAETGPDMVRVMTVHAAKGLEFKHVFIIGLVDKRFPSVDRGGDPIELPAALAKETAPEGDGHLEEERRLMYVAMTRAKDALYLTSAEDYGGKLKKKPSRFLVELGLVEEQEKKKKTKGESADAPAEFSLPIVRTATAPIYSLPASFSFTQLAAYAKCPWQYKFAHVLKLPVLGKWSLSFGRTMHGTLEKFMAEVARRQAGEGQADLFGTADPVAAAARLPVSKDELFAMYDECWQDDWYPDLPTKDKYRREGKEMLSKLYDGMADNPPTPLHLEKDFTLKIGPYLLRGKIDRMDQLPDGSIEIIDYKTGTPKEELSADDKRQLLLYQLAAERSLGLQPTRLTYSYLENGANVSFLGTDKEIAKFEADVEAQIDRIRDADFAATPGKHCAFCDFREICEFRKF